MKKANFKFWERLKLFKKSVHMRREPVYLQKPTFRLQEDVFLKERENFFSGFWRSSRMFFEYMRGFFAFRNVGDCITVFGSARFKEGHIYYNMAKHMGSLLAQRGFTVMTGGGPGIMEAANRGAKEANGFSISCNIQLPGNAFEAANPYVDKRITMHYFFVRKVMLTKYSLAFIVMPGGFGTLDELFEMSTLIQTHKSQNFPLVLMGREFWQPVLDFLNHTLVTQGTITEEDVNHLFVTDSPQEAMDYIDTQLKWISSHHDA